MFVAGGKQGVVGVVSRVVAVRVAVSNVVGGRPSNSNGSLS